MARQPAIYIPHGGGPCFFMDWKPKDLWKRMESYLSGVITGLERRPTALLVISAHWEANPVSITAAAQPTLIYDYYGFPPHTYRIEWKAPGAPALAQRVQALLAEQGVKAGQDAQRGLDHGVFIPLKLALPEADIPTLQLSLHPGLDPAFHLRLGAALRPLREEGVLIIGSGMSYHDVAALMGRKAPAGAEAFDAWLNEAATAAPQRRSEMLLRWADAPAARLCHPREEHLLPLHVVAGAAGEDMGENVYRDVILGANLSAFRFG